MRDLFIDDLLMTYCEIYIIDFKTNNPANIYLLKVNLINSRKRCEVCSKLTLKTIK